MTIVHTIWTSAKTALAWAANRLVLFFQAVEQAHDQQAWLEAELRRRRAGERPNHSTVAFKRHISKVTES